jgi:hypothetical protein
LRFFNVGWTKEKDENGYRLCLPRYVSTTRHGKTMVYRDLHKEECEVTLCVWHCPTRVIRLSKQNQCLKALGQGNFSELCEVEAAVKENGTISRETRTGTLIRTSEEEYQISYEGIKQMTKGAVSQVEKTPKNGVIWKRFTEYGLLIVGQMVIPSAPEATRTVRVVAALRLAPDLNYTGISEPQWANVGALRKKEVIEFRRARRALADMTNPGNWPALLGLGNKWGQALEMCMTVLQVGGVVAMIWVCCGKRLRNYCAERKERRREEREWEDDEKDGSPQGWDERRPMIEERIPSPPPRKRMLGM